MPDDQSYPDGDLLVPEQFDERTVIFLVRPPDAPEFTEEELDRLQVEHLTHLRSLKRRGVLLANGPLDEQTDVSYRGIGIYGVPLDEALAIANTDPMVKAGRLAVKDALDRRLGPRPRARRIDCGLPTLVDRLRARDLRQDGALCGAHRAGLVEPPGSRRSRAPVAHGAGRAPPARARRPRRRRARRPCARVATARRRSGDDRPRGSRRSGAGAPEQSSSPARRRSSRSGSRCSRARRSG